MKKSEVMKLLKANKNERGIQNWNKVNTTKLKSLGIGLTQLRKLAKKVGKNHDLAVELWNSDFYDAKIIAILIDDPKSMTEEQAEKQVEQLNGGYLAHVFSTCGTPLAKTSFVKEIADKWMASKDDVRRRCGFGLLYEIAKSKKKSAPGDDYFLQCVEYIKASFKNADISVLMSMGHALCGIGARNKKLNTAALKVARKIGPIDFDRDGKCDPYDVVKHLTSDHIKNKFAKN